MNPAARERSSSYVRETMPVGSGGPLPEVGDLVAGRYRIVRRIGEGAMGAVFAARHELLEKDVALKLMSEEHASTPQAVKRFLNEARALAQLESEHVARVLDMGQTEAGAPFLALELLEGADLAGVLAERGRLPVVDVVGWILQALDGIAEAHSLGIIHRDLKPANLFLAKRRDGTEIVKVLDFGISKNLALSGTTPALTVTSSILGSPMYMAPEQLRNAKTVDARADVWSLGVVLYELLSGRLPFRADNVAELFVAILEHTPEPMRSVRSDIPAPLEQIVMCCLAREADERFADVGDLAEALAPFGPAGVDATVQRIRRVLQAADGTPKAKARRASARRNRLRWIAAIAAAGAIAAASLAASGCLSRWLDAGGHASPSASPE
jgi:serine/threonine-protein kinase